jgi:hypothetical protein
MLSIFNSFFLIVAPFLVVAQHTFFKEYHYFDFDSQKSIKCYSAFEIEDGFIISGEKYDESFVEIYPFMAKLDKLGNLITLTTDSTYYLGYYGKSVFKNNSFYFVGVKHDFSPSVQKQKIIAKYDSTGELIWSKPFGDTSKFLFDNSIFEFQENQNGFVVFASSFSLNGTTDAEITFLDNNGEVLYQKIYSSLESLQLADLIQGVSNVKDGYVILIKSPEPSLQNNHYLLLKTDFAGNEIWRKEITNYSFPEHSISGLINEVKSITHFKNNSILVVFSTENNPGGMSDQIILAVFDADGNLVNSKVTLNDANNYEVNFVQSNADFDVFVAGSKAGDSTVFYDLFAAKFDSDLNLLWNKSWGYENNELSNGTTILTSDGGILIGGSILRYTIPQGFDFFLVKTDCNGNLEWDNQSCVVSSEEEVIVFGNPVQDEWLMHFPQLNADDAVEYELINSIGQIVLKGVSLGPIFNENVSNLSVGMYAFQLQFSGGKSFVGKVMKY